MAIIEILQYPDPRLRKKGERVEKVDAEIQKIVDDMFETHYNADNCAALAATQLNFKHPKKITVIDFSKEKNQPLCLINPEIIAREGELTQEEGCMSVGGGEFQGSIYEKVTRAAKIQVRALDRNGNPLEFEAEGYMAKCIQHELDHLEGKLFIDHLSRLKKSRIDKKIAKMTRLEEK